MGANERIGNEKAAYYKKELDPKLARRKQAYECVIGGRSPDYAVLQFGSHAQLDDEERLAGLFVTAESSFIDLADWDACVDPDVRPVVSDQDLPVWVGVDLGIKHDHTALVAVNFAAGCVRLVAHREFRPSADCNVDVELAVEATLKDWARRFAIQQIFYDPWQMEAVAQRLRGIGLPLVEYPQTTSNLTEASQNLYNLVTGRNLVLYADAGMRLAASRAIALETPRGWRISKEKASHKIDVIVALALACYAAVKNQNTYEAKIVMPYVAGRPRHVPGGTPRGGDFRAYVRSDGSINVPRAPGSSWSPPRNW